jgi:Na+/citrate or Na+/malate symporter
LIVITRRDRRLAAGAIWGPGLFILAWVVGGFMVDGYSAIDDHISSLAGVTAPSRTVMNLGFVAYIAGVGSAAWPLRKAIGNGASVALFLNALLAFGVLFTPEGLSSTADFLHGGFASLLYLSLAFVGPLAALTFRRRDLIVWAIVSMVVGAITAMSLWLSLGEVRSGLFQRIGLTATDLWLMVVGIAYVSDYFSPQRSVGGGGAEGD